MAAVIDGKIKEIGSWLLLMLGSPVWPSSTVARAIFAETAYVGPRLGNRASSRRSRKLEHADREQRQLLCRPPG